MITMDALEAILAELSTNVVGIRTEMTGVRSELGDLRSEIESVRTEMRTEFESVRVEIRSEFESVRTDMNAGFERVEIKINRLRDDVHQLDKDFDRHMEMHRRIEADLDALKKQTARSSRPRRPRR